MSDTNGGVTQADFERFKDAVRGEAAGQAAKWVIGAVVLLIVIAATGWWLFLKQKITEIVGGVPSGAIAAFDLREKCPEGWADFEAANGRFIIGSGKGENLTLRPFGQPGGSETHVLTAAQMPPHSHSYTDWRAGVGSCALSGCNAIGGDQASLTGMSGGMASGGAEPFEILPPYIALRTCKKS